MRTKYRDIETSVHRFNPNIVAISVVISEEIAQPDTYTVTRTVTYRDSNGKNFWTKSNGEKVVRGKFFGESNNGSRQVSWTFEEACAKHEAEVEYQQERVVNPKYRIALVEHPTLAEGWSKADSDAYNTAPLSFNK